MSLNFRDGSRYGRTTKRKKTNLILNVLIGIVFICIILIGSQLFFGKNQDNETEKELATTEQLSETAGNEQDNKDTEKEEAEETASKPAGENEAEKEEDQKEEEAEENKDDETEVSESSNDPNVIKTFFNPNWGPVGTTQSEPHASVYDESHVDWKEKLDAIHAATGLNSGDYTLYFLGNGGSEHKAVATIKQKSTGDNFKVYIEWVTGKGWKPTKVEQVKSL